MTTKMLMMPPSQSRKHRHEEPSGPEVATMVLRPRAPERYGVAQLQSKRAKTPQLEAHTAALCAADLTIVRKL